MSETAQEPFQTVCHSYTDLRLAIRARSDQLNISRETLDDVAGLTPGHSGKLLGDREMKKFGPVSLGLMLNALGLRLVVQEDPAALARVRSRLVPRDLKAVRNGEQRCAKG